MRPDEALRVVARKVAADLAAEVADAWCDYPEIGEHDWARVVELVHEFTPVPVDFPEAYAILTARAEGA